MQSTVPLVWHSALCTFNPLWFNIKSQKKIITLLWVITCCSCQVSYCSYFITTQSHSFQRNQFQRTTRVCIRLDQSTVKDINHTRCLPPASLVACNSDKCDINSVFRVIHCSMDDENQAAEPLHDKYMNT